MQGNKNIHLLLLCVLIGITTLLNAQNTGFINQGASDNSSFSGGVFLGLSSHINSNQPFSLSPGKAGNAELYWKDVVGIRQRGNILTKTAANGWGNAGAASERQMECLVNGWIAYHVNNLQNTFAFGLSNSNPDAGYTSIEYAVLLTAGQLSVYNYGQFKGSFGPVALNDSIRIQRIGSILFYTKNNVVFYNQQVEPKEPLLTDIAIYNKGAAITIIVNSAVLPITPLALRNTGTFVNISAGISLVIDGKITLESNGQFDNAGIINLKGDWNNISGTPAFANYLSPRKDVVEFTGVDQTIGGASATIFNSAILSGSGRKIIGDGLPPVFNGGLAFKASATDTITLVNQNKNPTPIPVSGNFTIPTGIKFQNDGTGLSLQNNLVINGAYSGSGALFFNGGNTQTISGVSLPVLKNLNVNKSGGNITLGSPLKIDGILTLTKGIIITDSIKVLTFNKDARISGGNDSAYVSGPVKKIGNTAFTFPLGDNTLKAGTYHPLAITAPEATSDAFTAEYKAIKQPFGDSLQLDSLESISNCEYWSLTNTSGRSMVIPSLAWNTNSTNIYNSTDLRVVGWDGTIWRSFGNGGVAVNGNMGTLRAGYPLSSGIIHLMIGSNRPPNHALTNSRNYIYTITSKTPTNSEATLNNWPYTNKKEEIHYIDGLGREEQIVYKKATPNLTDFVQPIVYDKFGRQSINYLPYSDPANDGSFKTNALQNQTSFYQNGLRVAHSSLPYSETVFDSSPLNSAIEQSAPGTDWQLGNNHTVQSIYKTNNYSSSIFSWEPDITGNAVSTGFYSYDKLSISQRFDEQGNSSLEYKDKSGRLLLTRKQIEIATDPADFMALEEEFDQTLNKWIVYQDTYNVYDLFGNLSVVIPPKAMHLIKTSGNHNTASLTEDLIFQYKYDQRKRLIQKKVPGAGWVFYVYNTLDQLVLTQDAQQRVNLQWTFFKYDVLGRVIMTGLFDALQYANAEGGQPPSDNPFNYWQQAISGYTLFEKRSDLLYSTNQGYTDYAFPQGFIDIQKVTYYDDYDFNNDGTPEGNFRASSIPCINIPAVRNNGGRALTINCTPYVNSVSNRVRGKVTAGKIKILDPASSVQWLTSVNFYDDKGQVIQIQANNQFGGTEIVDNVYDFSGKIVHTAYEHKKTSTAATITILDKYIYDQADRLTKVYQQNNNDAPVILSQNVYNELGQLIEENLHKINDAASPLQSIDYSYNIRSWLTNINNSDLSNDKLTNPSSYKNDDDNDLFGMEINYNEINTGLDNNPLFNGNISQVQWKSATDNVKKGYAYRYNPLSWLTAASYKEYNTTGTAWTQNVGRFDVPAIAYDANGNIQNMIQNGFLSNSTFGQMDNLNYSYSGNKITSVNDVSPTNGFNDFKDNGVHNSIEYTYDNNGNNITDANKATVTTYNHLNLPTRINFANGNKLEYVYDANGTRLRKKSTTSAGSISNTYYSGSLVYSDFGLDFISTAKGRIVTDANGGGQFRYEYNFLDQVGSTRLVFSDLNRDGVINKNTEVLQQVSYYPFGLEMRGLGTNQIGAENKFKFNSKELDDNFGLQLNDFNARMYDPQLGRMRGIDPLADYMPMLTSFRFALNNPISGTDPTGMSDFWDEENRGRGKDLDPGGDLPSKIKIPDPLTITMALAPIQPITTVLPEWAPAIPNITELVPIADFTAQSGRDRSYGGDGSGSFIDNALYITDQINQFNPIANGWDAISGYITGKDRFGNTMSTADKTMAAIGAIPFVSFEMGAAKEGSSVLLNTSRQLQAKFKHAGDFGVFGNYSKANASKFSSAINQHINSAGIRTINGTYRGQSVIHYLNPNTGLNVISNPAGQFISGWKLNPAQLQNVLKHGGL